MTHIRAIPSEHRVAVLGGLGDWLQYIPVFHHLSLGVEPKDVDPGPVAIPRPLLVTVEDHVIAFRDHPLELHSLARVLPSHSLEIRYEGCFAVGDHGIVLGVCSAHMALDCFRRTRLIEHEVVKRCDRAFVALQAIVHHLSMAPRYLNAAASRTALKLRRLLNCAPEGR